MDPLYPTLKSAKLDTIGANTSAIATERISVSVPDVAMVNFISAANVEVANVADNPSAATLINIRRLIFRYIEFLPICLVEDILKKYQMFWIISALVNLATILFCFT
jgi:hypothetical protein